MARKKKGKVVQMRPKMSLPKYIKANARKLELYKVYMTEELIEIGKGQIFVIRKKRNGDKIVAFLLVDTYCLGVKDAFAELIEEYEYDDFLQNVIINNPMAVIEVDPSYAHNIVYGSIEYAEDLGIEPCKEFDYIEYMLDDVESVEFQEIEFGCEGKPLLIYEPGEKISHHIKALDSSVGPLGYKIMENLFDEDFDSGIDLTFEELAETLLSNEIDRTAFLIYCSITLVVDDLYEDKIRNMKQQFLSNPHSLVEAVNKEVYSNSSEAYDRIDFPADIILAAVDTYLLNDCATEYLTHQNYIKCFDSNPISISQNLANRIDVLHYGQEKLDKLHNAIKYIGEMEEGNTQNNRIVKQLILGKDKDTDQYDVSQYADNPIIIELIANINAHFETYNITNYPDFAELEIEDIFF